MMARTCEACGMLISRKIYFEVQVRVLKTTENEEQNAIEVQYGDYCGGCMLDGKALIDVLSGLTEQHKPLPLP